MRLVVHRQIGRPTLASPLDRAPKPQTAKMGTPATGTPETGASEDRTEPTAAVCAWPLTLPFGTRPLALGAPLAPAPAAVPVLGAPGRASLSRVPPGVAVPGSGRHRPRYRPLTDRAGGSPSAGPNLDARRSTQNHPLGTLRLSAWRSHNGQTWAAILRSWGPASLASSSNHAQRRVIVVSEPGGRLPVTSGRAQCAAFTMSKLPQLGRPTGLPGRRSVICAPPA